MVLKGKISKRDIVLAALFFVHKAGKKYEVASHLHKMIVVAQEESGIKAFTIIPEKFGPIAKELPSVLEELSNEGLVKIKKEERESRYGYGYMWKITLTEKGREVAKESVKRIMRVLGGGWMIGSLEGWAKASPRALVIYVYENYPKYIERSIIREDVKSGSFS